MKALVFNWAIMFLFAFITVEAGTYTVCFSGDYGPNAGNTTVRFSYNGGSCDVNPHNITWVAGDIIEVPAGFSLNMKAQLSIPVDVDIVVGGNINFDNGKLTLTQNSTLTLLVGATLTCTGGCGNNDQITIGTGDDGYKYKGSDLDVINEAPRPTTVDNTGAALPITLISFTAHQSGQAVEVNWVTGSEENTSHFVVERSSDGRSFQGIGTVQAQGWSSEPLSYQWVDACPLEGRAYYRLRAVDFDEHTDWFGMERVDLRGKSCAKLAVYPNPVVNHSVSVRLNAPVQEDSFVALKNNQGRTVYSAEARTGEQHYQLPANIPSGLYILEVHTRQERHSARVVIK
jgi:hypothetical protein